MLSLQTVIIFGGPARMRCAQKARMNSQTPDDKLCGIVPVSEDWHICVCVCVFIILMCMCTAHLEVCLLSKVCNRPWVHFSAKKHNWQY